MSEVFAAYYDIVVTEEWKAFGKHFYGLTIEEKEAMAERLNIKYEWHDNPVVRAMHIKVAIIDDLKIQKYKPGYGGIYTFRRRELYLNMVREANEREV